MATISRELVSGVRCDRRGCGATIEGREIEGSSAGRHHYEALAETRGWTIWTGRTRYLRCPDHPVTPGKRIAGSYAQVASRTTQLGYPYCRDEECPCKQPAPSAATLTGA